MKRVLTSIFVLAAALSLVSARGKGPVKIGVVADVQYAKDVPDKNGRHYTLGPQRLGEAVEYFNGLDDLAFVADLGDMTDRNYADYADLAPVKAKSKVPFHNIFGNHDFRYASTPEQMKEVAKMKGLEKPYYSVVKGDVRFIFLHCGDVAVHSTLENTTENKQAAQWLSDLKKLKVPSAHQYNGGIGLKQLVWLDEQLSKADAKGQYAVVICHMLLLPFDSHETLWNSMEVVHLIENHPCTKAVFCGHRHPGSYVVRNGIHYVNFLGMVEGDNNRFAVVTVDSSRKVIDIDGIGDEPDRTLECR